MIIEDLFLDHCEDLTIHTVVNTNFSEVFKKLPPLKTFYIAALDGMTKSDMINIRDALVKNRGLVNLGLNELPFDIKEFKD